MKTGERWSSWKSRAACSLLALPLLLHASGCAKDRVEVEKNLMAQASAVRNVGVTENYRIGCPDLIELVVTQRPEFSGRYQVGVDGVIDLGEYGKLGVQGKTLAEIVKLVAAETGANLDTIQARVLEFHSQYILLFGEISGLQRSVPYRGQETVLDLLQRVGGITPGAEPRDVYVVRPHLGDSKRPELFHVDLSAIVIKHDDKTNIRLLPYDQVYVGETRQAQVEKAIPPWLRWTYQSIWESAPPTPPGERRPEPGPSRWVSGAAESAIGATTPAVEWMSRGPYSSHAQLLLFAPETLAIAGGP